jgi:Eukaryotic translation initiation factor 3 subunit 7 (eIF-3)
MTCTLRMRLHSDARFMPLFSLYSFRSHRLLILISTLRRRTKLKMCAKSSRWGEHVDAADSHIIASHPTSTKRRRPLLHKNSIAIMPGISLADTIGQLRVGEEWGPDITSATTLDGVPYAPYSKGDKLGRMADWTQEGKEGRDRGGRQYGRNFRGQSPQTLLSTLLT